MTGIIGQSEHYFDPHPIKPVERSDPAADLKRLVDASVRAAFADDPNLARIVTLPARRVGRSFLPHTIRRPR